MNASAQSKIYHRGKNILFFISLAVDIVLLLTLILSGMSVRLRDFSFQSSAHSMITNGIYLIILSVGLYFVHGPLNWFEGFYWEKRFGLSNQNFFQWFKDDLKKGLLVFLFFIMMVETAYILLGRFPTIWWVWVGVVWLIVSLFLARVMPQMIIPMFYKYADIEDFELKKSILKLFERCGVPLRNVCTINLSAKTKKANAFICGLGQSRRVVLSDTLLKNFSVEEIETVVAHELGHYQRKDILRLTLVNAAVTFLGFYFVHRFLILVLGHFGFSRIDDIAFFPMLALVMIIFIFSMMPVVNGYSRLIERQADRFSLDLTGKPHVFIMVMRKLGQLNLAEFEPSGLQEFFFYDHPAIGKRIKFAEGFKRG